MHRTTLHRETTAGTDILDLTGDVSRFIAASGVEEGWALIEPPGPEGPGLPPKIDPSKLTPKP